MGSVSASPAILGDSNSSIAGLCVCLQSCVRSYRTMRTTITAYGVLFQRQALTI